VQGPIRKKRIFKLSKQKVQRRGESSFRRFIGVGLVSHGRQDASVFPSASLAFTLVQLKGKKARAPSGKAAGAAPDGKRVFVFMNK
jgi:hypothetical protein